MASGFALRAASCPNGTTVCRDAATVRYATCCPSDSRCLGQVDAGVHCCPTAANCTATNLANPRCANRTWNLYDGPRDRFFCCDPPDRGYALADGRRAGCAPPAHRFDVSERLLTIVPTGTSSEPDARSDGEAGSPRSRERG